MTSEALERPTGTLTAAGLTATLAALGSEDELSKVRKRLAPDEPAFGLRMRDLFGAAKAYTDLPLSEVHHLLDSMPRPAVRLAIDKLEAGERSRYLR